MRKNKFRERRRENERERGPECQGFERGYD